MTASDPTLRQVIVLVPYVVLGVPASTTVAGYFATVMTRNASSFEGAAGYAWTWWLIVLTCACYVLAIGGFVLLRRRLAIAAIVTIGFAALSVPTFRAVHDLLN